MPAFIYKLANKAGEENYISMTGWMWYSGKLDIVDEGWKLHVSGNAKHGQDILDRVLPVLRKFRIGHKFIATTEELASLTGTQVGKFLAVYPDNIGQAFIILAEIDRVLDGVVNRSSVPVILGEKRVGNTVVYTRYGAYNNHLYNPVRDMYVSDTRGQEKPDWIDDPWSNFNATENPNWRALSTFAKWPKHARSSNRN